MIESHESAAIPEPFMPWSRNPLPIHHPLLLSAFCLLFDCSMYAVIQDTSRASPGSTTFVCFQSQQSATSGLTNPSCFLPARFEAPPVTWSRSTFINPSLFLSFSHITALPQSILRQFIPPYPDPLGLASRSLGQVLSRNFSE